MRAFAPHPREEPPPALRTLQVGGLDLTDPDDLGLIEASPYVLAGPGPWAPDFAAELRRSLTESAGTGG